MLGTVERGVHCKPCCALWIVVWIVGRTMHCRLLCTVARIVLCAVARTVLCTVARTILCTVARAVLCTVDRAMYCEMMNDAVTT